MCKNNEHKGLYPDETFFSDDRLAFECRQAMLRKEYTEPAVDVEWSKFYGSIHPVSPSADLDKKPRLHKKKLKTRYFTFGSLAGVAAAILLVLVFRWYDFYLDNRPVTVFVAQGRAQEIVMHIGDGRQTILASANKVNDPLSGVVVTSHKADFRQVLNGKIQMRTIKTPYGKDYRVVLQDGTEVIMNADSKLTFPTRFSGTERVVLLEGEAYFKVAKNPAMPFLVKTDKINTRALGTEFNVRAYKGSDPHVTLIEGVVVVDVPEMKKDMRLLPSDDVSLSNKTLKLKTVDPQYYIQWKDGFLYYDNVALGEVLSDIGRWYNVDIDIEKPALMSYRLHFVVNRGSGIEEVVENLNDFKYLQVVQKGNKILIGEKK